MRSKPVVLVPACNRRVGDHPFHIAGRKYIDAVRLAGAIPLVVPAVDAADLETLLDLADGVLLTGSPSNVHPSHFGEELHDPQLPLDPERDDATLALIPLVLARGMPLFAICRGAQEVNVALGGTLHQAVHEVPGLADHRDDSRAPLSVQYGPAHPVRVVPGGRLADIARVDEFQVNSLHGQGIKRLASGLRIEATAPDGLIEAFSMPQASGFNLCVQWHPEWQAASQPMSMRLLQAFGDALRQYRDRVRGPLPAQTACA